jgi:hypothetical protein
MFPAPIQLMKLQLHRQLPCHCEALVWPKPYLVLPSRLGKCAWKCCRINTVSRELVLRGLQQKCSHNPNEISAFDPELVLRDVPGKSA